MPHIKMKKLKSEKEIELIKIEVKKWLMKSESDLKHAMSSLKLKDYDWTQLASQQAAEKILKALCIQKGFGLIRTHELAFLARKVNAPQKILQEAGMLSSFYSASRYPDAEGFIEDELFFQGAKDSINATKEIIKWCKKQIKI